MSSIPLYLDDYITEPLPEWQTTPRGVVGYTKTAQLITSFFDFSQLKHKQTPRDQGDLFEEIKEIVLQ